MSWLVNPTMIAFGYTTILLKSSITSVSPIPSIIIASDEAKKMADTLSMIIGLV